MDFVFNVLFVLSLLGVVAYAVCVYQALSILFRWARDRWSDDWGRRPLLLRVPPKVLTWVLALAFLAVLL